MLKNIVLTFFIAAFAMIAQVDAQTAAVNEKQASVTTEKQTAVKELVALLNADNNAEALVGILSAQMDSLREATINSVLDDRTDLTAAEKDAIRESLIEKQKETSQRFQEKLMQKLNYNEMINEIATVVYDKYFTLEEIKELIAFYKTPTGQKTLKTMAPLMADTLKLTQEKLLPKIPEILRELQEEEKQEIERQVNTKKPRSAKSKTN